jgi:RIO-like serine/threonine protein kinase
MTLRVAHLVKALSSDDFRILRAIEKLRMKHEFAPIEFLPKISSKNNFIIAFLSF